MISKIDECFSNIDEATIQTFVRKPENMAKLNVSLPASLSRVKKLLVPPFPTTSLARPTSHPRKFHSNPQN